MNYENFADLWKAELFNADEWAKLFAESGAKYLCLVSKHHEGFCLFDSSYSKSWNSLCMGPKRDITEELLTACEKRGIHRGVYYSLLEWEHPISGEHGEHENYVVNKMIPEMKELVEKYQPELIFTDGEWDTDSETWHSREFLSYLIEESPVRQTVVFNDRWGKDTRGQHGGYLTTEYGEVNSTLLKEQEAQSNLKNRKWEECRSLSHSFGFNRREGLHHYLTEKQMIELLTDTVAKGGNLLLNVAPNADGSISPLIQERLQQMGNWMKINGEAIYGTKPLSIQNSLNAKATKKANTIFLFLKTYVTEEMTVHAKRVRSVELLGYGTLPFRECSESISFSLPAVGIDKYPLKNVFTVKISLL